MLWINLQKWMIEFSRPAGLKMGTGKSTFWSEIGSQFGESSLTPATKNSDEYPSPSSSMPWGINVVLNVP